MVEAILTDSLFRLYSGPGFAPPFSLHPYVEIGQLLLTAAHIPSIPLRLFGAPQAVIARIGEDRRNDVALNNFTGERCTAPACAPVLRKPDSQPVSGKLPAAHFGGEAGNRCP
jgi:hypothetical protein